MYIPNTVQDTKIVLTSSCFAKAIGRQYPRFSNISLFIVPAKPCTTGIGREQFRENLLSRCSSSVLRTTTTDERYSIISDRRCANYPTIVSNFTSLVSFVTSRIIDHVCRYTLNRKWGIDRGMHRVIGWIATHNFGLISITTRDTRDTMEGLTCPSVS